MLDHLKIAQTISSDK